MAETTPDIDLDSVIDRLLEGEPSSFHHPRPPHHSWGRRRVKQPCTHFLSFIHSSGEQHLRALLGLVRVAKKWDNTKARRVGRRPRLLLSWTAPIKFSHSFAAHECPALNSLGFSEICAARLLCPTPLPPSSFKHADSPI